jgi:hypothetical protein
MSQGEKQVEKKEKKYNPNEIHPRAQSKLDELQRRGLIGNNKMVKAVPPKPVEDKTDDEK